MKLSRKLIIFTTIIVVLVITGLVGVVIQSKTTYGTENYSGVKMAAAQNALQFDQSNYGPALFAGQTKAHVASVAPSRQGIDSQGKPLRCTDDPNDIHYYSVTVRRVWLFGLTYGLRVYKVCNTAG